MVTTTPSHSNPPGADKDRTLPSAESEERHIEVKSRNMMLPIFAGGGGGGEVGGDGGAGGWRTASTVIF